jgi:tetratricopeptide (TPR) repeat protein
VLVAVGSTSHRSVSLHLSSGREEGGDHGLCRETAVLFRGPPAAEHEQFIQFGGAVGPQDVGGPGNGDARAEVAGCGQGAGVDGHPLQAGGADLVQEGGELRVASGGVTRQQEDRDGPGGDLGDERAPGGEDLPGVGFGVADLVGSLLGRYRARSGQAPLDDGRDQPGLAAEALVDGLDRYPRLRRDGGHGGGGVAAGQEQELLDGAERQVLARLAVFAGGFDLAAAEAVTAGEVGEDWLLGEIVALLGALVDKSLVQFEGSGDGPVRYRLLETVRQYAARKLERLGSVAADDARRAHRDQYLALAESAAPHLVGHDQAEWLDRLDLELDNIRAAIGYSLQRRDLVTGIRLVATLRVFWKTRGYATEGIEALRALLDLPTLPEHALLRARGLAAAAYLLEQTGGYAIAEEYCEEGLAIARGAGDHYLTADLLYLRALVLLRRGQPGQAVPVIESGLGLARQHKEPHVTAHLLEARSFALDLQRDHAGAARDARESVLLSRQAGDRRHVGTMLGNLGYAELSLGEPDAARAHLAESLDIARALSDDYGVVYGTLNLGLAEYLSGSPAAAEELFTESLNLAGRMRIRASIAYALIGLAMTGSGQAGMSRSARLHGAAAAALAALEETIEPLEGELRDRDCQRLRSAMGAKAFEAEYAAGRALTTDEVFALARGERA